MMTPFAQALFASAPTFSAFDPAFLGTSVTLSADKRTATFAAATRQSTKGTLGRSVGRHYFEIADIGVGSVFEVGLCKSTEAPTNGLRDMPNGVGWDSSGGVYVQNALSTTWGTYGTGDLIGVAVDVTNRKIWLRKGAAGNWNNDVIANQNPATGTGGLSFSGITGTVFPAVTGQNSSATTMMINTGQEPFVGARPDGFYIWE